MLTKLKFRVIGGSFAICQLPAADPIPEWAEGGLFTSITRSQDELSIVCTTDRVPLQHQPKVAWFCLKLEGPFPFSQVGILHSFIQPLAESGIPIFAIATYDTDYVLIQGNFRVEAMKALENAGHELVAS